MLPARGLVRHGRGTVRAHGRRWLLQRFTCHQPRCQAPSGGSVRWRATPAVRPRWCRGARADVSSVSTATWAPFQGSSCQKGSTLRSLTWTCCWTVAPASRHTRAAARSRGPPWARSTPGSYMVPQDVETPSAAAGYSSKGQRHAQTPEEKSPEKGRWQAKLRRGWAGCETPCCIGTGLGIKLGGRRRAELTSERTIPECHRRRSLPSTGCVTARVVFRLTCTLWAPGLQDPRVYCGRSNLHPDQHQNVELFQVYPVIQIRNSFDRGRGNTPANVPERCDKKINFSIHQKLRSHTPGLGIIGLEFN